MASPQHPTTIENLPGEVLSDIFIRLLAKQLAQMRCVCKSWNVFLSESSFVKYHLHCSIHNKDETLLFFRWGFSFNSSLIPAHPSRSPGRKPTNVIKLPVNPQPKNSRFNLIGSVNGLICFSHGPYHDYAIYIWNPSLSAVLTLPSGSVYNYETFDVHSRFGYDPKTDDYKVIKFRSFFTPPYMKPRSEVYSMRKGSWKLITPRLQSQITWIFNRDEVFVDGHDGHLHWLCATDVEWKVQTIVAFDLVAETFSVIPLPDSIQHRDATPHFNVLGVLAGKLCVVSKVYPGVEVWVMDEYAVAESWVKHYVFSQFSCDITPYGFTLHNEFLFRDGDHFRLYDPIADQTKIFKITGGRDITKIVEYVDSLVSVAPTEREMSYCSISHFQFR